MYTYTFINANECIKCTYTRIPKGKRLRNAAEIMFFPGAGYLVSESKLSVWGPKVKKYMHSLELQSTDNILNLQSI